MTISQIVLGVLLGNLFSWVLKTLFESVALRQLAKGNFIVFSPEDEAREDARRGR